MLDALVAARQRGVRPLLLAAACTVVGHTISPTGVALAAWSMGVDLPWAGVVFTNTFTMVGVVALFLFPASYLGWDALYSAVLSVSSAVPLAEAVAVTAVARLQQTLLILAGVLALVVMAGGLLPHTLTLPGRTPRVRRRPLLTWPKKMLLGLSVCAAVLLGTEFILGRLWPYEEHAVLVHPFWQGGEPLQSAGVGWVERSFQGRNALAPIPVQPTVGRPRVLVFGESSVHGSAREEDELPARLEQRLRDLGTNTEVLNLGCPAIDSQRMREISAASVALSPAVAVIYAGHNDVGNHFMRQAFGSPDRLEAWQRARRVERFGLVRLAGWMLARVGLPPGSLALRQPAVVDAGALQSAAVAWGTNLDLMVAGLQAAGVEVIVMTVVSDLAAWPTPLPSCLDALPEAWRINPQGRWRLVDALDERTLARGLARAPQCAEALHLQGRLLLDAGQVGAAIPLLQQAKDLDPIPLRATEAVLEQTRRVAAARGVSLVDTARLLEHEPAPWAPLFLDQLYPSAAGSEWLAAQVAPAVQRALLERLGE